MASRWTTKIERCSCSACGWKATRAKPKLCPACKVEPSTVVGSDRATSWKASHRDPSGLVRSRSFKRKEDADGWLDSVAVSIRERTYRDPSLGKQTLAECIRQRLATTTKLGESSKHLYRQTLRLHVEGTTVATTSIRDLTPRDLQAYFDELATKTGARTVEITRNLISGTLAQAVRFGDIPANPCARLELAKPDERRVEPLRPEQVEDVADAIDPRYRALVLIGAYGALRFGEAAGLRLRDLHLLRGEVRVAGQVVQVGAKVQRVNHAKTKSSIRTVAIPAFLVDVLAAHLAAYPVAAQDDLVFRAPEGGPLSRTVFRNRYWLPALQRAGLGTWERVEGQRRFHPAATFHDLRHVGVSLAIEAGAHPLAISRWVGHKSIVVTMDRYGHLFDQHEGMAADLDRRRTRAIAARRSDGDIVALTREATGS